MSNEEEEGGGEDVTKKTERKRQREKQRRFDLTNAFDELATVLSKIEPGDTDLHVSGTKKKRKRSIGDATDNGDGETSGMTRLDLIGRTVDILKKLHADNRELRSGPPRESSGEQVSTVPACHETTYRDALHLFSSFFHSCVTQPTGSTGNGTNADSCTR